MAGFLRVVRSLALLLARVGLGGILVLHGWRRWQQLGIDSQIAYLRTFATPFASYAAWGGTILELVGGIFLILGALVPLVAAAVVVEQVLIIAYTSWYKGWSLTDVHAGQPTWAGGWEYNVILGLLALLFVVYGGGAVGIDRLFRRKKKDDTDDAEPEPEQRQRLNRRLEPAAPASTSTPTSRPSASAGSTGAGSTSTGSTSTGSTGTGSTGTGPRSTASGPADNGSTTDTLIRPRP